MPFKAMVKYLLIFCLFLAAGIQALVIALPAIVESQIKSRLPESARAFHPEFSIAGIGMSRTILRDVRMGQDLNIDLIELGYNWNGGASFGVEKLIVSGLSLTFEVEESGQVKFNDLSFPRKDKENVEKKISAAFSYKDLEPFLGFIPRQVRIKHANITIRRGKEEIRIPWDMMAGLDGTLGTVDTFMRFTPLGQRLELNAAIDLAAALNMEPEKALKKVEARLIRFNPEGLTPFFPDLLRAVEFSGPLDIRVARKDLGPWQVDISGGRLKKGNLPELQLSAFKGQAETKDGGVSFAGKGTLKIHDDAFLPIDLGVNVSGSYDKKGDVFFNASAENQGMEKLVVALSRTKWIPGKKVMPDKVVIHRPSFFAAVTGTPARPTCRFEFAADSLGVPFPNFTMKSEKIKLNALLNLLDKGRFPVESGKMEFKAARTRVDMGTNSLTVPDMQLAAAVAPEKSGKRLNIDLEGKLKKIKGKAAKAAYFANSAGVEGRVSLDRAYTPSVDVTAVTRNFSLKMADKKLAVAGMDLKLPWTYPFKKKTPKGHLNIKSVTYTKQLQAGFTSNLTQTGDTGLTMAGQILTPLIPDLLVGVKLSAGLDKAFSPRADLVLDTRPFLFTHTDLSRIAPGMDIPGTFQVDLSSQAKITLKNNSIGTSGAVVVNGGSLDFPDMDLKASGLSGKINLNNLIVPESLPGQSFFIKHVSAGQFRFNNGALRFCIEDGRSLNIENLRFNWCNGMVSTEALRIPGEDDTLSLTLYCDRLEMVSLLQQLGAFDAQGDGSLSGRIPVTYNNGEITFDNGFLFSTPGQGGRIFVRDLDRMLDGFPKGTAEYSQLDLAGEALKDFEYKWAKLRMHTRGDTLDVLMELDGRPARVLPFEYKKEMNSFMRVDASSPGSKFQGIKLDVNLKLPFNRVMKFGTKLKDILE